MTIRIKSFQYTHRAFLQNNVDRYHFENVEIHLIGIFDETYVARVDVPLAIVRLDAACNANVHRVLAF